jgi:hypothetical protein
MKIIPLLDCGVGKLIAFYQSKRFGNTFSIVRLNKLGSGQWFRQLNFDFRKTIFISVLKDYQVIVNIDDVKNGSSNHNKYDNRRYFHESILVQL